MSFPHVTDKLPLWVGGDLMEQDALPVRAHLEHCPECRFEAAAYRDAMSSLRMPPQLPFTEAERTAMRLEIMARVRKLRAPKPTRATPWLLAAAASIPAMMLFHALYALHGAKEKPVPAAVQAVSRFDTLETARKTGQTEPAVGEANGQTGTTVVARQPLIESAEPAPAARRERTANASIVAVQRRESSVTRIEFQTANPDIKIIWFTRAGITANATTKLGSSAAAIRGDSNEPLS